MNDFEIKNNLLKEISSLANSKYGNELTHAYLWGSASALLNADQLKIIKSVLEK